MASSPTEYSIVKVVDATFGKVRWVPPPSRAFSTSNLFVCGTSDDSNSISLWSVSEKQVPLPNPADFYSDPRFDPSLLNLQSPAELHKLAEIPHYGRVNDMLFLDAENCFVASSIGSVSLFTCFSQGSVPDTSIQMKHSWENQHYYYSSNAAGSTCLAIVGSHLLSAGEDGRIVVLSISTGAQARTYDNADSTTINGICTIGANEFITAANSGILKLWDLRRDKQTPAQIFKLQGDPQSLSCAAQNPSQPQLIVTGSINGNLTIWDIRFQSETPITNLHSQNSCIWELHFHPIYSDYLFTCSEAGSLWQWGPNTKSNYDLLLADLNEKGSTESRTNQPLPNFWMNNELLKTKLEIRDLLSNHKNSINSFDILNKQLITVTGGESIYYISNLAIQ